jgi:hypothetical protein
MLFRKLLLLVACIGTLAACFTGERPYFVSEPCLEEPTGDAVVDEVIAKLFAADTAVPDYSASYQAVRRFGNVTSPAFVVVAQGRRSITVNTIRYLSQAGRPQTCELTSGTCSSGFDLARISDTGLTVDFYGTDSARRLCRDAQAALGPATAREESIAGQPAKCVDLTLPGGTATYCVLSNGVLAKLIDGDVLVDLVTFSPTVDEGQFTTGG